MARSELPVFADTAKMTQLGRAFRMASPAARRACTAAIAKAMEGVLNDARSRAEFSDRIPQSGHLEVTRDGVILVFDAPDAAPIENKGKGNVRHPVFGNREVWTSKNSHAAFATPALHAGTAAIVAAIEKAVVEAVARELEGGVR